MTQINFPFTAMQQSTQILLKYKELNIITK